MCQKKIDFFFLCRYPGVAIKDDGSIWISQCTCQQMSGGKCCHVGALLYLIEDLSWGQTPKYEDACTSQPQAWGKGSKVDKNPKPLHLADYGQKRKPNKYYNIDPRPLHLRRTTKEELNNFVTDNQYSAMKHSLQSNWDTIFAAPTYDDYVIDDEQRNILQIQRKFFLDSMREDLMNIHYNTPDTLSTACSVHLNITLQQSENNEWFKQRLFRITASIFTGEDCHGK